MKISVSKLSHHPQNEEIYTLSNIDDLVQSIQDVGLLSPLVIDKSNQVISGNRRLAAIRKIGWTKVDVEVAELCDEDVVPLLIHHNKQRVKSTREILNEYRALEKIYGVGQGKRTDLDRTIGHLAKGESARDKIAGKVGVSSRQMGRLLFIDKKDPDFIKHIDEGTLTIHQAYLALQKRVQSVCALGQSSSSSSTDGDNRRFFHKSSHQMDELEDGSVQLVFTSPPYWRQRKYTDGPSTVGEIGNEDTPEEYVSNLISHLGDVKRVLSPKGSFFLNLGDKFKDMTLLNLPHKVVIGLQEQGWLLRNTIIWKKTNSKPSSSKSNLQSTYEFIFHLTKSKSYYYHHTKVPCVSNTDKWSGPQIGQITNSHQVHQGQTQKIEVGRKIGHNDLNTNEGISRTYTPYIGDGTKNMGDFWTDGVIETAAANHNRRFGGVGHPAPYPHSIVVPPLLQTTREGDLVLDPFHGSGTTGDVATSYGRRYCGYDLYVYS